MNNLEMSQLSFQENDSLGREKLEKVMRGAIQLLLMLHTEVGRLGF